MSIKTCLRCLLAIVILTGTLLSPAKASVEPGNIQWALQDLPARDNRVMLNGSSIVDIAVASDGKTVYVANILGGNRILKTTNGGESFDSVQGNYATIGGTAPVAIAVAPDDVKAVGVTDGARVIITNDSGTNWSLLPSPLVGLYAGATITDVAVSPRRAGNLFGREYVISIADPATGPAGTARGDVLILSGNMSWESVGAAAPGVSQITGVFDFTSVTFTPNFAGDRCVVAVGTKNTIGSTAVLIVNTVTRTVVNNPAGALTATGTVLLATGSTTEYGVAGSGILTSDIALPSNFDPTTPAGRRGYVSIACTATFTDNDVYRFDDMSARALGCVTSAPIKSVAYSGTTDSGTLFAGLYVTTDVKYTTDIASNLPVWTTSLKSPTGASQAIVKVASDYATSRRVFAGSSGTLSAFFVSTNGGVSFDGESLISNGASDNVGTIDGIEVSSDSTWLFLASRAGGSLFLYKSITPVTSTSWSLVLVRPGTQGLLKLNQDWASTPAVYLADKVAGGNIFISQNGGGLFSIRNAPSSITPSAMAATGVSTVYLAGGVTPADARNIYRSENGGFTWSMLADSHISSIISICIPLPGTIIAGGSGAVSYSTDGGITFTRFDNGLATSPATYYVTADIDYSTNRTIFAGSSLASTSGTIYRCVVRSGEPWENLTNTPPGAVVGMASQKGALYGMGAASAGRTINPLATSSKPSFENMNLGGVTGAKWFTTVGLPSTNLLYAANDAALNPMLWAFNDWLAKVKIALVDPPAGFTVPVDPVTGYAEAVTLSWQPAGSGAGLVDTVSVEIDRRAPQSDTGTVFRNITVRPDKPSVQIVAGATTAGNVIGYTMEANSEYMWYIRFSDTANNAGITSTWSDPRIIFVEAGSRVAQPYQGPVLTSPAPGATGVSPGSVGLTWAPVPGATEYEVIIATDATLIEKVLNTPVSVSQSAYQAIGLEYEKAYFWAVRVTKPAESVQSIGTFTTMQKPSIQPTQTGSIERPVFETPVSGIPFFVWGVLAIGVLLVVVLIYLIVADHRAR